ncbi:hypothetical protein [Thalassobacillus sp. C254]|uniref:hypothetical protein n=1 Tax=Thalassobacillus sp. C254 TaxID=1225341 RepID=UPI0006CFB941|nr:hypothetical protein [Thalassobacillus sp. C254]
MTKELVCISLNLSKRSGEGMLAHGYRYEYVISFGTGPMIADIYFFGVNDNMVARVQIGNISDGNVLRIDSKEFEHRREDFPFPEFLLSFVKR